MDDTLKTALEMRSVGFAMHYLRPRTKVPLLSGWSEAPVMSEQQLIDNYQPGYNIGFRAGKWSLVDNREVVVLDVDIKGNAADAAEAYREVDRLLGMAVDYTVQSGSGAGRHLYLFMPVGTSPATAATTLSRSPVWVAEGGRLRQASAAPGYKPAWTVELLSTGKNVAAPTSIHPDTGNPYTWL
jgi:hypothetical protein